MRSSKPLKHFGDDQLLAYLDGELPIAQMRAVRNHLRICWNCRSALAELEAQIESISRLLLARTEDEGNRSLDAKENFLRWRNVFEAQRRLFTDFPPTQLFSCHLRVFEMVS